MHPDRDADVHQLYHSAERLREISWTEGLASLSVLADSLSTLLGACPSRQLNTITLRLEGLVIEMSEDIATYHAWTRLCETLQDPKFRGLKRFDIWLILDGDSELDTVELMNIGWLEAALAPLRATGVLAVSLSVEG
jgi:hypothetical protein